MIDLVPFQELEKCINESTKGIKLLKYVRPSNSGSQRDAFFRREIENPSFTYEPLKYDPQNVRDGLGRLSIPDGDLSDIFTEKKKIILLENEVLQSRGNGKCVRELTAQMHGTPNTNLVTSAISLLNSLEPIEKVRTISAEEMKKALEEELRLYDLSSWRVELIDGDDDEPTTTSRIEKKIKISKNRKFAERDLKRLRVHEVGVHVLRAVNGEMQKLGLFKAGFPHYLSTEEGLTTYFEDQTGNSDSELMRDYAARAIAVHGAWTGQTFRETFEILKGFQLSESQAWKTTVRAYRGGDGKYGGYIKDHIYLQGLKEVSDFIEQQKGDVRELYIGKIGIKNLPLIKKLEREGFIEKPKYLPLFLSSSK